MFIYIKTHKYDVFNSFSSLNHSLTQNKPVFAHTHTHTRKHTCLAKGMHNYKCIYKNKLF